MARVSFTLRRNVIDRGSYVRYDTTTYDTAASAGNAASAGTWVQAADRDSDAALRSDGYSLPPVEFSTSYLEASAVAYGIVYVEWAAPLEALGPVPAPYETVLVYSPYGPAPTISSGEVLSESTSQFDFTHSGLTGGQWAYYTLFIRYRSSGGDDYYEPAASVEVLVPENYGSTTLLWDRIPEYYRNQDASIGQYVDPASDFAIYELGALPANNIVGPLFKFISIFGFEMDLTRTIIDYTMVSKDPGVANSQTLDATATTMGVGLNSRMINSSRIRAVLDDIGYLRRSKGTLDGLIAYGRALSASDVEVDTSARTMKFYSQRVNYITDPLDANITNCSVTHRPAHVCEEQAPIYSMGSYDPTTYVSGDSGTYPTLALGSYIPGMYWTASASAASFEGIPVGVGDYIVAYNGDGGEIQFGVSGDSFAATNYSAYTSSYSQSGTSYTPQGTGASVGVTHVLFHIDCPIPVKEFDSLFFSVHSSVGTSALRWVRLVDASGNEMGRSRSLTMAGDSPAGEVVASQNVSADWTIGFVEFLIDLSSVSSYELEYMLAERNHLGEYFDGSSTRGGWIVDEGGGTVSDYRWSAEGENNGNAYESISIYTQEYQRTRALLTQFFARSLPITLMDYYTVTSTDAIPGQDAIDTYLTTP